eukprot:244728-Rhodomonas_salina.1
MGMSRRQPMTRREARRKRMRRITVRRLAATEPLSAPYIAQRMSRTAAAQVMHIAYCIARTDTERVLGLDIAERMRREGVPVGVVVHARRRHLIARSNRLFEGKEGRRREAGRKGKGERRRQMGDRR